MNDAHKRLLGEIKVKEEIDENAVRIGRDEIKCQLCDTMCSSISDLQTHTLNEHVEPPKKRKMCCQQCGASFDSFASFATHMRSHLQTPTPSKLSCSMCPNLFFGDPQTRIEHISEAHFEVRFPHTVCTDCLLPFPSPATLANHFVQTHLRIHFQCTTCAFIADNEKQFREHSLEHSKQETLYSCGSCGVTVASSQLLTVHVQLVHDREKIFEEKDGAGYQMSVLNSLSKPEKMSKTERICESRILQCSVCDEAVVGEDGLDEHRLLRHCKVRHADKCAECRVQITTEADFVEHCSKHSKDMTVLCPVCRQSLRSDTQVHAHKRFHMTKDEKQQDNSRFVCPICGQNFDEAMSLIEHGKAHADEAERADKKL